MAKTYLTLLADELRARVEVNPAYSLRNFARDLGLSPGTLSQIFSGKIRPSNKLAERIVTGLGLSKEATNAFFRSLRADGMVSSIEKRLDEVAQSLAQEGSSARLLDGEEAALLTRLRLAPSAVARAEMSAWFPDWAPARIEWAVSMLRESGLIVPSGEGCWQTPPNLRIHATLEG